MLHVPSTWQHTAGVLASLSGRLEFLLRSCAELNLAEEHSLLTGANRRLLRWRARIAIIGSRHSGKTTLLNALLGQPVFETGPVAVEFPVMRVRAGPRKRIELLFASGHRETARWESHRDFLDTCLAVGAAAFDDVTECRFYLPDEPGLLHLDFVELRAPDEQLLRASDAIVSDAILLLVSARAPLFDGALEFVQALDAAERAKLLVVVTQGGTDAIADHVRNAMSPYGVPVVGVDAISQLEAEIEALLLQSIIVPLVTHVTADILRACHAVETAAAFSEQAMRTAASDYQRSHQAAVSDLEGLARCIAEFEQALVRSDSEINALAAKLSSGFLDRMEQAAFDRMESADTPAASLLNTEARQSLAEKILAEANQSALRALEPLADYAVKEFRHAVSLAVSELLRIRSSAEVRVQEIAGNFLGPEIAPEPLSPAAEAAPVAIVEWLTAQTAAWIRPLSAAPGYKQQTLAGIRQIFLNGLKQSIARHWEIAGPPEEAFRKILDTAAAQFFRTPARQWLQEMRAVARTLDLCFASRRLHRLAWPESREARTVLADLNAERKRQCGELREYAQRLALEIRDGYANVAKP